MSQDPRPQDIEPEATEQGAAASGQFRFIKTLSWLFASLVVLLMTLPGGPLALLFGHVSWLLALPLLRQAWRSRWPLQGEPRPGRALRIGGAVLLFITLVFADYLAGDNGLPKLGEWLLGSLGLVHGNAVAAIVTLLLGFGIGIPLATQHHWPALLASANGALREGIPALRDFHPFERLANWWRDLRDTPYYNTASEPEPEATSEPEEDYSENTPSIGLRETTSKMLNSAGNAASQLLPTERISGWWRTMQEKRAEAKARAPETDDTAFEPAQHIEPRFDVAPAAIATRKTPSEPQAETRVHAAAPMQRVESAAPATVRASRAEFVRENRDEPGLVTPPSTRREAPPPRQASEPAPRPHRELPVIGPQQVMDNLQRVYRNRPASVAQAAPVMAVIEADEVRARLREIHNGRTPAPTPMRSNQPVELNTRTLRLQADQALRASGRVVPQPINRQTSTPAGSQPRVTTRPFPNKPATPAAARLNTPAATAPTIPAPTPAEAVTIVAPLVETVQLVPEDSRITPLPAELPPLEWSLQQTAAPTAQVTTLEIETEAPPVPAVDTVPAVIAPTITPAPEADAVEAAAPIEATAEPATTIDVAVADIRTETAAAIAPAVAATVAAIPTPESKPVTPWQPAAATTLEWDDDIAEQTVGKSPEPVVAPLPTTAVVPGPTAPSRHYDESKLPPLSLLQPASSFVQTVSEEDLLERGILIEERLAEFKVKVSVVDAYAGPVITRFEVEPAVGVRGAQIVNLMKDLARALGLASIRVVETIPGKTCMGLELPNPTRAMIRLSEVLADDVFTQSGSKLTLALGKDITGKPSVMDLAKAPHMLVAGTTGSGKSVGVNAMILSLLYKATPEEVRFIMVDPKMLELSVYDGIPHLLAPVVTDMKLAANALNWCVAEMEKRYRLLSAMGVRNLAGFNQKVKDAEKAGKKLTNPFTLTPDNPEPLEHLPFIVVVVDEFADLMMVAGKKIEELIARLAQKARAAGIHLILATQRPSVDVITGLIKANIPTRLAFQVSSKIDSRTILDQMGAEALLGQGDMLFLPPGTGYPQRVHGAFVADDEVHQVVEYLKQQFGEPDYVDGILNGGFDAEAAGNTGGSSSDAEADPLYDEAVAMVMQSRRASISSVQRQLRIGYNRAARLIESMEAAGLVSAMESNGNRTVLAPGGE
ncbi:hypothetical protein JHS3_05190 [Jeongeupia sp. HS-3]|uniref:FtsK/SpoIIIE family DNA translocase n=1 Tax=Jeongeupia sp. HS-3 TaxID=1009682 RepID=UPI0018A48264|nr:DNA translocase FtsK [Jeongeupia sp. HS-3]BCL74783.1 hypothetical protein JHS3_05190 [Jeongeupia sp. HS-3]